MVFAPPSPLGVAIQNKFRTGLGEFKKPLKRIIKSPSPGPRVLIDGHTGEQQLCEFSPPLRRPAPVPDDLEARQNRQSDGDVMRLFLEARAGMTQLLPKLPLGGLVQ